MRGLRISGPDAFRFNAFDRLGYFLLEGKELGELTGLLEDDLIQLIVLVLQVRKI